MSRCRVAAFADTHPGVAVTRSAPADADCALFPVATNAGDSFFGAHPDRATSAQRAKWSLESGSGTGQRRITGPLCVRSAFGHGTAARRSTSSRQATRRSFSVASKPRFTRWPCAPANASTESVLPPPLKNSGRTPIPPDKSVCRPGLPACPSSARELGQGCTAKTKPARVGQGTLRPQDGLIGRRSVGGLLCSHADGMQHRCKSAAKG